MRTAWKSAFEELLTDHKVLEFTISHMFKTQGMESESRKPTTLDN